MNESRELAGAVQDAAVGGRKPSQQLLRAAVSGLIGISGAAACGDDAPAAEADPDESALNEAECEEMACECDEPEDTDSIHDEHTGAGNSDAAVPEEEVEKELKTENVRHTFAELAAMCDERGGYIETHGSCSGVNTCQGFTYGDWGEEAQLVEHTCSGVNGCAGLSCLVPERPVSEEDGELTGEEILKLDDDWYLERAGAYGPKACRTCHVKSEHNDDTGEYDYDYNTLRVLVWPDAERDASNWTERDVVEQEHLVAFGASGIKDGIQYSNMVSYAKLFSKAEIKAVVEYMRSFEPENIEIIEIKLQPGEPEP